MDSLTLKRNKIVPVLTSNTSNAGISLDSTDYNSNYQAYKAFNGSNANSSDCWLSNASGERHLIVGFPDSVYLNGLIFTSRNTTIPAEVLNSDYDVYTSNDKSVWKKIISFGSPSDINMNKQILFPKVRCKYIKLVPLYTGSVAIGELNFYSVEEFYILKQGGKYYSFHPLQYNTDTKSFNEVAVQDIFYNITKEGVLGEKYYLTSDMTIGGETFKPIDKFTGDEFQLVSVQNKPMGVYGLKSKRELVIAKADFSTRLAEHIDYFKAIYDISDTCSIKMVASIDKGKTWLTTQDMGATWSTLISDNIVLDTVKNTDWNNAKDSIFTNGFNLSDLDKIDFNTISNDIQTMRFAYVIDINDILSQAVNKSLDWQFDARGTMKLLSESDVDIELRQYEIIVTPKANVPLLKINVGTGGNITVNNITGTDPNEASTDDIINVVNGVWS